MQGKTINGFELKRLLGVGGMAEVWFAENEIGMKAAVKILSEELSHNDQMKERFLNEAKVMVQLDHPNIRKVHGYGLIDGRPAIIMEYLGGSDLKTRMKQGQHFTDEELKRWWNQMVDALNYTHAQDIVHRDIKPSNIFIDWKGNAKLLDFGIAKVADTTTGTLTGSTLGTRIYMSPEQVKDPKRVGTASDVYSLAVTFVHLLTGKAPYDSTTSSDYEIQVSIVTKPVDMSKVPEEWRGFLTPYLNKEADKRPALRHFELVDYEEKTTNRIDDDMTLAEDEKQPKEKPVPKPKQKVIKKQKTAHRDRFKSKKGLWIALGIVVAVFAAVFLLRKQKPDFTDEALTDQIYTVNGVSFTMKPVEGGTFQMGSQKKDLNMANYDSEAEYDENPVHSVSVNSFYMGETEVTQALWKAVMGTTVSQQQSKSLGKQRPGVGDDLPMYYVNWNECHEFISKLNEMTGKNFRLPTEAEWEYAAKGGKMFTNSKYAGSDSIDTVAWYWKNSGDNYLSYADTDWGWAKINKNNGKVHPVKSKLNNELGLYDMSGNVWEWCSDWYDSTYYESLPSNNPKGPSDKQSYRVIRGGAWTYLAWNCRVSDRTRHNPDDRRSDIGFRLCLPVSEPNTEFGSEAENIVQETIEAEEKEDFITGSLEGVFSVGDNKKVVFSKGNLQYQASTNTWRFAEKQLDCIGEANANISPTYNGWIDLFGWGTSGYDHGAVCYMPYSVEKDNKKYCAYGSKDYNLYDQSGKADWGYNRISNGGNTENLWRCLTENEWEYLIDKRKTKSNIRFARAVVNGVKGLLLLPDDWDPAIYKLNKVNVKYSIAFKTNVIPLSDWDNVLQSNGVVFLPEANGCYWSSSSYYKVQYAPCVSVCEYLVGIVYTGRCVRNSVRLVKTIQIG